MTKKEIQYYKDKRNLEKGFNDYWNQGFEEAVALINKNEPEQLILYGVVKSLKVKDLMTFEDYKNNLFIKSDGVYQPKKTKLFRWYSEKQLKKMYKDKPL